MSLIVGHVTHASATLWVRGERRYPYAQITLADSRGQEIARAEQRLASISDFTATHEFTGLEPDTAYVVHASLRPNRWPSILNPATVPLPPGRFTTRPDPGTVRHAAAQKNPGVELSFLAGSCNMSNAKINNLLGLVAGMAGFVTAQKSMRHVDNAATSQSVLEKWIKSLVALASWLVSLAALKLTRFRLPPPPLVVSPFLRLAAMLDITTLAFESGRLRPPVGSCLIGASSGAAGFVAFPPTDAEGKALSETAYAGKSAAGLLQLVRVSEAQFKSGENLHIGQWPVGGRIEQGKEIASVSLGGVRQGRVSGLPGSEAETLGPPSFMLHMGDQIYFDFPEPEAPDVGSYRRVYREAWIEDALARHFLSQCPQYMTLDDHEIFNNYSWGIALDPKLGYAEDADAEVYARAALRAYDDYVASRQPGPASAGVSTPCAGCGKTAAERAARPGYYYAFQHGPGTHFFVLDTRTERWLPDDSESVPQMISCCQMHDLKGWLEAHAGDLLFVVSSVPFVPEVYSLSDEGPMDPAARVDGEAGRSVDKWCAPAFSRQRGEIVRHIHEHQIARVVFLVGDVHCCYQASLRAGDVAPLRPKDAASSPDGATVSFHDPATSPAWREKEPARRLNPVVIHELAAGPVSPLRLGRADNFFQEFRGRFRFSEADRPELPYITRIHRFFSLANAIMRIDVEAPVYEEIKDAEGKGDERATNQNLRWSIFETIATPSLRFRSGSPTAEAVMTGRISLFCN